MTQPGKQTFKRTVTTKKNEIFVTYVFERFTKWSRACHLLAVLNRYFYLLNYITQ